MVNNQFKKAKSQEFFKMQIKTIMKYISSVKVWGFFLKIQWPQ